jgi:hypothetical protein
VSFALVTFVQTQDMDGNRAFAVNWLLTILPFLGSAAWDLASAASLRHRDFENDDGPGCIGF